MAEKHLIDPRRVPIRIVELELGGGPVLRPVGDAGDTGGVEAVGHVLALVRVHGRPIGLVAAHVADPPSARATVAAVARAELGDAIARHLDADRAAAAHGAEPPCARRRAEVLADAPMISVVIATRERPAELARCLESVTRLAYPRFEVVVVDNAPATDETGRMLRRRFGDAVTYVREPVPGLAMAHNSGVRRARGEILAFTDDDVVVDPGWLAAIAEGFASGRAGTPVGCVTGLILPGELETRAQALLEARGRFGKGFARRYHDRDHTGGDALFPFSAGRLGSGANMAFSAALLRRIGGFDAAIGAGSPARGGDDLLAFYRTITAGYGLVYQPDALVWHHHRRAEAALAAQAFGYGTGLGAYLTGALVHEPAALPALLRRAPRGVAYALARTRPEPDGPAAWPRHLSTLERRGMLYGPYAYARSRWQRRGVGR